MNKKTLKISKKTLGVSLIGIVVVGTAMTAATMMARRPGRSLPPGKAQQPHSTAGGGSQPAAFGQLRGFGGSTLPAGWPPRIPIENGAPVLRNAQEVRDGQSVLIYAYRSQLGIEANYTAFEKYLAENAWEEAIAGVSDNGKELAGEREGERLVIDITKNEKAGSMVNLSLFKPVQK